MIVAVCIRHVKPSATCDASGSLHNVSNVGAAPPLSPSVSSLDVLLNQVKDAAALGNLALVEDRLGKLKELCSFGGGVKAMQTRTHSAASTSASSPDENRRKPGGLSYAPEYMLQVVRLADTLSLALYI